MHVEWRKETTWHRCWFCLSWSAVPGPCLGPFALVRMGSVSFDLDPLQEPMHCHSKTDMFYNQRCRICVSISSNAVTACKKSGYKNMKLAEGNNKWLDLLFVPSYTDPRQYGQPACSPKPFQVVSIVSCQQVWINVRQVLAKTSDIPILICYLHITCTCIYWVLLQQPGVIGTV